MRGMPSGVRSIKTSHYNVTLYDILKSYSNFQMKKNFMSVDIPRLPVFTTEAGIKTIKNHIKKLTEWREISKLIPKNFLTSKNLKKSGLSGIFSASLELSKEGVISIMQNKIFDKILIKQRK